MSHRFSTARGPGAAANRDLGRACRDLVLRGLGPLVFIGEPREFAAGAVLLRQGDLARHFLVVASGRLKARVETTDGGSLILGLYGPGDLVGIAEALAERCYRASVVTLERSGCVVVDREELMELLIRRPSLIRELLPRLVQELQGCTHCLAEEIGTRVEIRLARLFLKLLDDPPVKGAGEGWIGLRLTRRELAELTGTTVESCSRVMSDWRRQGLVVTADDGFLVRNPDGLRQNALG